MRKAYKDQQNGFRASVKFCDDVTYSTSQELCPRFTLYITPILQGYFTGTGAILGLPQCQWSNPEEWGINTSPLGADDINTCITFTWFRAIQISWEKCFMKQAPRSGFNLEVSFFAYDVFHWGGKTGLRASFFLKINSYTSHWGHWWCPLQPTSSVITDAKSADLNLDDFARKKCLDQPENLHNDSS